MKWPIKQKLLGLATSSALEQLDELDLPAETARAAEDISAKIKAMQSDAKNAVEAFGQIRARNGYSRFSAHARSSPL